MCLQNVSATHWMGKQDLRECDYVSTKQERYLLDRKQDLRDCNYLSAEYERYLLDGETGFKGL